MDQQNLHQLNRVIRRIYINRIESVAEWDKEDKVAVRKYIKGFVDNSRSIELSGG
jgi:hypothetical protein